MYILYVKSCADHESGSEFELAKWTDPRLRKFGSSSLGWRGAGRGHRPLKMILRDQPRERFRHTSQLYLSPVTYIKPYLPKMIEGKTRHENFRKHPFRTSLELYGSKIARAATLLMYKKGVFGANFHFCSLFVDVFPCACEYYCCGIQHVHVLIAFRKKRRDSYRPLIGLLSSIFTSSTNLLIEPSSRSGWMS